MKPSPERSTHLVEPNQDLSLAVPGPRRAGLLLWRAATLRCPRCGKGPVLVHWLKMRASCGNCGKPIDRGEEDYFIGSMLFNLLLAEGLFAIAFAAVLIATLPNAPWGTIEIVAPIAALVAPFVLYPFSKLMWLAVDLLVRPERE